MAKFQSAGVYIQEIDESSFISESGGGYSAAVIKAGWGPAEDITLISDVNGYAQAFQNPSIQDAKYFFGSKRILSATNLYNVVRAIDENAMNATNKEKVEYTVDVTITGVFEVGETVTGGTGGYTAVVTEVNASSLKLVDLTGQFVDTEVLTGGTSAATGTLTSDMTIDRMISIEISSGGPFEVGETVTGGTSTTTGTVKKVDVKDQYIVVTTAGVFQDNETITGGTSSTEAKVLSAPLFNDFVAGILIKNEDEFDKIASKPHKFIGAYPGSIGNSLVVSITDTAGFDTWEYKNIFENAPDADEFHIVVVDKDGSFYNSVENNVLEYYAYMSKDVNAIGADGTSSYYRKVLNEQSAFVYVGDNDFVGSDLNVDIELASGANYNEDITDSDIITAYELFTDPKTVSLDYVSLMDYNTTVINSVIANVIEVRKDCIAFVSPQLSDVLSNQANEDVKTWGDSITFSNYVFLDNNWIYELDTINNQNIWTPACNEVMRIKLATDNNNDVWFSPMGYNRGILQNVIKLAYSPNKGERDVLTQSSINPIFTEIGQGSVLLGDRCHLAKDTFLRQIGVRALFNKIETDMDKSAKYIIGEFNNEATRNDFTLKSEKYLEQLKSRQAFRDYLFVCDETNNTEQVIAEQGFQALIKILPQGSVSWVLLTFTPVAFSEQLVR